ncbi:MAG: lyase [Hyphomicrobium sp.]|nr:lyase [Hyphomicrobium sp.]
MVIATSLSAALPVAAAATKNPIGIREWKVPYEGRPRDPFVARPDEVWFVGQINGYLARLTPSTGEFFKRDLGEDAGPHNLIVDDSGIVWFAGNLNAYIGRYDPETDSIERIEMPNPAAVDPHTLIFDADQSHIWFTVQGGNFIGRLTVADRSVDLISVPTEGARPYGIKIAPDGTPWIALFGTDKLASVDPETLDITEYTIPDKRARPRRLEITDDGRIWYSDYARGKLGRYDPEARSFADWPLPSGDSSSPYGTALDDSGRIWIVETGRQPNLFVGFDTKREKVISITQVPSGGGTIRHMVYHPQTGSVWYGADAGTIGNAEVSQVEK